MVGPTLKAGLLLLFAAALAAFATAALFLGVGVVGFVLLVREEGAGVLLPSEEELLEFLDGGDDRLVDPQGSHRFASAAPSRWVQARRFDGLYHEIFNEADNAPVTDALRTWLDRLVPPDR